MLELRPNGGCCDRDLPAPCGGGLVTRRSGAGLAAFPAAARRTEPCPAPGALA